MRNVFKYVAGLLTVFALVIGFNLNTAMAMPTYLNDGTLKLLSNDPVSDGYCYMDTSSIQVTDGGKDYYEIAVNIAVVDSNYNWNRTYPVYYRFYYNGIVEFTPGTGGWRNINDPNLNPMYKTGSGIILWYVNNSPKVQRQLNALYE